MIDEEILCKDISYFILVCVENILIVNLSSGEHCDHLRNPLDRLRQAKLYDCMHEREFVKEKIEYLGYKISAAVTLASVQVLIYSSFWDWPTIARILFQDFLA